MPHLIDSYNSQLNSLNYPSMTKEMEDELLFYYQQIRWRYIRLFMMGWMKGNKKDGCLLHTLPRDIMNILMGKIDYILVYGMGDECIKCTVLRGRRIYFNMEYDRMPMSISIRYMFVDRDHQLIYSRNISYITYNTRYNRSWLNVGSNMTKEYSFNDSEELVIMTEGIMEYIERPIRWVNVQTNGSPMALYRNDFRDEEGLFKGVDSMWKIYDLIVIEGQHIGNHEVLYIFIHKDRPYCISFGLQNVHCFGANGIDDLLRILNELTERNIRKGISW